MKEFLCDFSNYFVFFIFWTVFYLYINQKLIPLTKTIMKKITITLLSLIASASFAQTTLIDFESGSGDDFGDVDNEFSFGRASRENNRFLDPPYDANPSVDATNGSARVREVVVTAAADPGFGAYRLIFRNQFDVNTEEILSLLMRSSSNVSIGIRATDNDPDNDPTHVGTINYTGNGEWQLVETTLTTSNGGDGIYPVLQFDPPGIGADYTFQIDDLTLSTVSLSTGDFAKDEVSVYPIPATLAVNIRGNISGDSVDIYDVSGSLVGSVAITGDFNSVDVSTLAKGVYFMQLENGSVLKFVK